MPGRRHDVATLALDRLHENGGRVLRVEPLGEQVVLDGRHAAHRTGGLATAEVAAVAVAVGDVVHLGQEWREPGALYRLARRQAQATVRAAVKRAGEGDDRGPPGRMPRQLDRALHGLGPRVREKHALLALPRRERRQPLAQCRKALEVEVAAADMKEARRRLLD